ncbi:myrosinase 1-like isoform X2 [Anthonomus grandis grandis]|uniref:myrosinase 1-like isoform X2 n=1 Tax=Anthonomus grandis grandis TaxID=2921223 RepID=UPI0021655185|nr:myrosinase 1-like isoform X2 [Anthonomus grandis grandis]
MYRTFVLFLLISSTYCDSSTLNNHHFPKNFKLGAATAAYQIEGGWNEDGKGVHMWDWYTHTFPEKIKFNYTADVACDSYHKWEEDVKLLKNLGVSHYRMSISWSRILPNGTANNINLKGVEYYLNIFKALKEANIEPMVTLYHWDLPIYFHEMGGWYNPLLAKYFGEYARVCYKYFGEYVKTWITINEPQSTCLGGYAEGTKAPGYIHMGEGLYQCAYVHLLAHASAYHIYDKEFREAQQGRISIVIDSGWAEPASDSDSDVSAAQVERDFVLGIYANPIYNGDWPQAVIDNVAQRSYLEGFPKSRLPQLTQEEIDFINGTSDFFCLNTYSTNYITSGNKVNESIGDPSYYLDKGTSSFVDPSWPSDVQWVHLVPWGFRKLLKYVYEHFNHPEIFVTENGWADLTGQLNDTNRITYISEYLSALLDAHYEDGVNVTGYTVWSLLDNFEWTNGYTQKLGLVQVDFQSENRTRTVIEKRCLVEECIE